MDLSSLRPITLLPTLDKGLEHYVKIRIVNSLSVKELQYEKQFSFVVGKGTIAAIEWVVHDIGGPEEYRAAAFHQTKTNLLI